MSKADELKKEVRESVAKLVQDVMTDSVSRLTKAATKRALKKLKEKLKEKAIHKLEEHLTDISEQGLEGKLDKGAQQIADQLDKRVGHEVERITQDNFERVDSKGIEKSLEKSFKKPLSSPVQPVVISIVTVAIIGGGLWAWTNRPQEAPPLPPSSPTPSLAVPAAPTDLVGEATLTRIELTWKDNSYDESGFLIQCSINDGITFAEIGTTPANDPAFNHTNITPGSEYIYRVYAFNATGNSEPSNTVSVTAFTLE